MISMKYQALQVNSLQLLFYQAPLSAAFLIPLLPATSVTSLTPLLPATEHSESGLLTAWSCDLLVGCSYDFFFLCLLHKLHHLESRKSV